LAWLLRFKQFVDKLPDDTAKFDSKRAEIECDRALQNSATFRQDVTEHLRAWTSFMLSHARQKREVSASECPSSTPDAAEKTEVPPLWEATLVNEVQHFTQATSRLLSLAQRRFYATCSPVGHPYAFGKTPDCDRLMRLMHKVDRLRGNER
jgi:hypothetical protein